MNNLASNTDRGMLLPFLLLHMSQYEYFVDNFDCFQTEIFISADVPYIRVSK